jgi:hypothetical protein
MSKRDEKSGVFKITLIKAAAQCGKCQVTSEFRSQRDLEAFLLEHNPHNHLLLGNIKDGEFKAIGGPGKFVIRKKKTNAP